MQEKKEIRWIWIFVIGTYLVSGMGYLLCLVCEVAYFIPILAPIAFAFVVVHISKKAIRIPWKGSVGTGLLVGAAIPIGYLGITFFLMLCLGHKVEGSRLTPEFLIELFLVWPFAAVCEEVGWRGVLLPLLKKVTSYEKACLFDGVIWFGWHIPLLLNRELVTEFPLWQGACFFLIEVLCITFIMGALSDSKYGASIWVYISLHAVHNILIQAMVKAFGEGQAKLINDGGYLINLVLLVAAALFGWTRIRKRKKR